MIKLKIDLYTIEGCESCHIMSRILNSVIDLYKHSKYLSISFISHHISNTDDGINFRKTNNIFDFPTTRFVIEGNENIKAELRGTYPKGYIIDLIDKLVNNAL